MSLEFNNLTKAKISPKIIKKIFNRFLKITKLPQNTTVSVALVGKSAIKKLNQQYRGLNQVTDVLSFSDLESSAFPGDNLGEVVICYPVAVKQAKKFNHSISQEIEILLTHGLVHLLGYEHETDKEAAVMEELEKKILDL